MYDPNTKMTEDQIPEEYQRHAKVFSEEASAAMPPHREFDHAIKLTNDAPAQINCRIYPLKEGELAALRKEIAKGKKEEKYKESDSEYAAPIFFIKKKDGSYRMIIDFRELNKYTIHDNYPLPLIETLVTRLRGKKIFTKFNV